MYKDYLKQYYSVRAEEFRDQLGSQRYANASTLYDADDNTVFLLAVNDNKVIGGCQMLFSTPQHRIRLKFESPFDVLKIENLLPHIDTTNLTYAEIAGVAVKSSAAELNVGLKIQKRILRMMKEKELYADVFIGRVTPKNVSIILRATQTESIPAVVRDDLHVEIEGLPRVMMMYTPDETFPLLSEEMKTNHIGVPKDEFLSRYIETKRDCSKLGRF